LRDQASTVYERTLKTFIPSKMATAELRPCSLFHTVLFVKHFY
jgi:hypothetical protein